MRKEWEALERELQSRLEHIQELKNEWQLARKDLAHTSRSNPLYHRILALCWRISAEIDKEAELYKELHKKQSGPPHANE